MAEKRFRGRCMRCGAPCWHVIQGPDLNGYVCRRRSCGAQFTLFAARAPIRPTITRWEPRDTDGYAEMGSDDWIAGARDFSEETE